MEEELTEPELHTMEHKAVPSPSTVPTGTHSEVNGDLPGNPYLMDGVLDVMDSPEREPVGLQYPGEYNHSHQFG